MNPSPTRGRERNKPPNRKAWSMSGVHGERGQAERQEQAISRKKRVWRTQPRSGSGLP